jgi:hypothetical protein
MASGVFGKLNLTQQTEIVVVGAPASFEGALSALRGVTIRRSLTTRPVPFVLAFVTRLAEIESLAPKIAKLAEGDAIVWFAYPKGSSKRYTCDFNRDIGWDIVGAAGFEAVRMVAIDEDWSAKRYRRPEFIKNLTRDASHVMSAAGKKRVAKKGR